MPNVLHLLDELADDFSRLWHNPAANGPWRAVHRIKLHNGSKSPASYGEADRYKVRSGQYVIEQCRCADNDNDDHNTADTCHNNCHNSSSRHNACCRRCDADDDCGYRCSWFE